MASPRKTDNASLSSKIAIRRWLLDRMRLREIRVLDTCAGLGHVWQAMEDHVTIRQWTRCDVKPRRAGTVALSAVQALERFRLDTYDVVDIDPYGEPWEPYRVLLRRMTTPMAVFLTHGHVMQSQVSTANLAAVGLPSTWPIPRTPALSAFVAGQLLSYTWRFATVRHAARIHFPRVTYYALALEPLPAAARQKP
jgi:hypothetical protein